MSIAFTVHAIPVAKGRPRIGRVAGRPRAFTPAKTRQAEADFIALADPFAPAMPIEGAVDIRLVFTMPIPPSKPRWFQDAARQQEAHPRGRPDLDNMCKLVLDSMNRSGRWWRDDAQVVSIHALKAYGLVPQTWVEIRELPQAQPPRKAHREAAASL